MSVTEPAAPTAGAARCVLLTGARGLVGGDVLRRLLRDPCGPPTVIALLRERDGEGDGVPEGVEVVHGDITLPELGLSETTRRALQERVDGVLHCAATTRFNVAREDAQRINVDGTRHVLDFAAGAARLRRLGYVSTAFVAGRREGVIREDELEHEAGFVNHYEWSKYRAEQLVRASGLPWSVYRLSTIVGDSVTGRVRQWNALHQALALYYRGLAPVIPGRPGAPVDLVPDDFVAAAVQHLFTHAAPGETFHVCSGAGRTLRLDELLDQAGEALREAAPAWRTRAIEPPSIVDGETFDLFGRSAHETGHRLFIQVYEAMRCFVPQMLHAKVFDTTRASRALEAAGIAPPPMEAYFGAVVRYCVAQGWGRRGGEERAA